MQITAILSSVTRELGSSQRESDKIDFVKIPFMENSNIAKSGTGSLNSKISQKK